MILIGHIISCCAIGLLINWQDPKQIVAVFLFIVGSSIRDAVIDTRLDILKAKQWM